jgi:RNA polymerase sigma-70 factor (TIGR02957 family)
MAAAVEVFEEYRTLLLAVAYRMLGSMAEAEDVVQEAWLRWSAADGGPDGVRSPRAFLVTVVTNLCLDQLKSARARREQYAGVWLPEPVATGDGTLGPLETAVQRESVSIGLLALLETLTPTERAVFVLREAFGSSFREIAEVLGQSEANCRQVHRRARLRVETGRRRFDASPEQHRALLERFLKAAGDGDVQALQELLAADASLTADGGGKAAAARRPVTGAVNLARYLAGIVEQGPPDLAAEIIEVNGTPSIVFTVRGKLFSVMTVEVDDGRVRDFHVVINPDKLQPLARQLNLPVVAPWGPAAGGRFWEPREPGPEGRREGQQEPRAGGTPRS